jgi:dihydroneopterin aldolase
MLDRRDTESSGDVILLENVQVPAALGVSVAERRMRRPVRVDLEIGRDLRAAGQSDRIRDSLDYSEIYRVVEEVASGQEHRLVEALGERIAAALLRDFEIRWVRITVRKSKPVAGVLDYAGIRLTRHRGA